MLDKILNIAKKKLSNALELAPEDKIGLISLDFKHFGHSPDWEASFTLEEINKSSIDKLVITYITENIFFEKRNPLLANFIFSNVGSKVLAKNLVKYIKLDNQQHTEWFLKLIENKNLKLPKNTILYMYEMIEKIPKNQSLIDALASRKDFPTEHILTMFEKEQNLDMLPTSIKNSFFF